MSPLQLTQNLSAEESGRLFEAVRKTLLDWTQRLREEAGEGFPEKVTAFRKEMAVHGRYGQPCPVCNAAVQRIVYAENECNYCARCQTEGRLLADRSLSRLLKDDWPKSFAVVSSIVEADAGSVLIADAKDSSISLTAEADIKAGLIDLADASLGLTVPDPKLRKTDDGEWEYTEPDWDELRSVVTGHGPKSQDRLDLRREARENSAWVRKVVLAQAA